MCVTPRSRGTGGPTSYIPFSSTQSTRQDRNRPRVRNIGRESRNSGLCESVLHRVRLCMLERCDGPVRIRNGSNIPRSNCYGVGRFGLSSDANFDRESGLPDRSSIGCRSTSEWLAVTPSNRDPHPELGEYSAVCRSSWRCGC